MSSEIPQDIRNQIKAVLWEKADKLGWENLAGRQRTIWYENWVKDQKIGGILAGFMDPRQVRVYIKDSLLKSYSMERLERRADEVFAVLRISPDEGFKQLYDKPPGRMLLDGRILSWGNSRDWKSVLISVFERAYRVSGGKQYAAVLLETGQTDNPGVRELIGDIGARLGLTHVSWID